MGRGPGDAEQQLLDVRRIHVDAADDEHVVVAARADRDPRGRTAAGTGSARSAQVTGAVADQRHRLLGQRGEHELTLLTGRQHAPVVRIDHLDQEVVLLDVQAVADLEALGRHAGPHISDSP